MRGHSLRQAGRFIEIGMGVSRAGEGRRQPVESVLSRTLVKSRRECCGVAGCGRSGRALKDLARGVRREVAAFAERGHAVPFELGDQRRDGVAAMP